MLFMHSSWVQYLENDDSKGEAMVLFLFTLANYQTKFQSMASGKKKNMSQST
jgi:hypothetical protein